MSSRPDSASAGDYKLAQRAAGGDMTAFEEIYWTYHRQVFGICLRMVRNVSEAEELTQQIFVQLFRKIESFRGESAFSTWLHRLTVNWVLMYFRKTKASREEISAGGILPETAAKAGNRRPGDRVFDRLLLEQVIGKLPKGYKRMVILHDICGYEHEEIAQMLHCSSGTSKSQLYKARRKLRRLLSGETPKGGLQPAG
ncbi:MAG: RNA polymerase sigma factor [Acidobacteria bacterium]|nr:RNA polymerase sigma factor [Acidobacteriota bacterium]